jgi:hypothetical protein
LRPALEKYAQGPLADGMGGASALNWYGDDSDIAHAGAYSLKTL